MIKIIKTIDIRHFKVAKELVSLQHEVQLKNAIPYDKSK
jgi:hypothetical protein